MMSIMSMRRWANEVDDADAVSRVSNTCMKAR